MLEIVLLFNADKYDDRFLCGIIGRQGRDEISLELTRTVDFGIFNT